MPGCITEIDLLDEKIACGQLIERYRYWHLSKVTHKSLRLATRCQTRPLAILRRPMRDHPRRPWPWPWLRRPRPCSPRSSPPDLRRDRSFSASEICGRREVTVSLAAGRRSRRARAAGFTASVGRVDDMRQVRRAGTIVGVPGPVDVLKGEHVPARGLIVPKSMSVGAEASSSYWAGGSFTQLTATGRSSKYFPRSGAAISSHRG